MFFSPTTMDPLICDHINDFPHEILRLIFAHVESAVTAAVTAPADTDDTSADTRADVPTVCKLWHALFWPPEMRAFLQSRVVNRAPETRIYQIIKRRLVPLYGRCSAQNIMYAVECNNWEYIEHLYARTGTLTQELVELAAAVPRCFEWLLARIKGIYSPNVHCDILLIVRGVDRGSEHGKTCLDYAQREKLLSEAGFLAGMCALYTALGGDSDFASYLVHTMSTQSNIRPSNLAQYLVHKYKRSIPPALAAICTCMCAPFHPFMHERSLLSTFRYYHTVADNYTIGNTTENDIPAFKYSYNARKLHVLLKYADWDKIAEHKVALDVVHLVHYLAGEYAHAAHEAIAILQAMRALCVWERPCGRCTNATATANPPPDKKVITAAELAIDYMQKQLHSTSPLSPTFASLLEELRDEHVTAIVRSVRSERVAKT